jgi:hypothetical protein
MVRPEVLRLGILVFLLVTPALPQERESTARPAVIVPASSDRATTVVHFSGIAQLAAADIALGALSNDQKPNERIVPSLTVGPITGSGNEWDATITVGDLIPFGETTVPLLWKRQPNQTLRFYKAGLIAKPPADGGFQVREGKQLYIELENPTAFDYPKVRARLRFQDLEVCAAIADKSAAGQPGNNDRCDDPSQWVAFSVPKHTPVTLRVGAPEAWFRDAQSGFPKAATRKGVLNLQFLGDGQTPAIFEQTLPLDVQFSPNDWSVFGNLVRVGAWLVVGALLALLLRITIPNYRRKSALKQQLGDAAKATRAISDDVESMLRVLLRVERLNLDQFRESAWISGPGFVELAERIEQGLAVLKRRIESVRRLDNALGRKSILLDRDVPPTRLAIIDRQLDSAYQVLMRDQLAEQDWVMVQQFLEGADKYLGEPTQEEKDAFQALLVQRWKSLRDFFGMDGRRLKVPPALSELVVAFPTEDGLPKDNDPDGTQWVAAIGHTRADLQLGALEIMRDYLFLAPAATAPDARWGDARDRLKKLCATPSRENLVAAHALIHELEEGIDAAHILCALRADEAAIEMNPQSVQPNEKARLALRFKDPDLNSAAARRSIQCEWTFANQYRKPPRSGEAKADPQTERGWEIYRYFSQGVTQCDVTVRFFLKGEPVMATPTATDTPPQRLEYTRSIRPQTWSRDWNAWWTDRIEKTLPETLQLAAALLVPLATLAVTQTDQGNSGRWWELAGVGFSSEIIRGILTGKQDQGNSRQQAAHTQ